MSKSKLMKCNQIQYRQGYIEITPNIHEGCINIESWHLHPNADMTNLDIRADQFPEEQILANTEIELTIAQAKALITNLQWAINQSTN